MDEEGKMGGASDHNMIFTRIKVKFVVLEVVTENQKMMGWDIKDDQNWRVFRKIVEDDLEARPEGESVECEQNFLAEVMVSGLEAE